MASEFTFTNPEAAKQAIARLQLQAALAENSSRENIAREQTQAQRYATQSQISEREKDRQVSRDSIASQERWRSGYGSSSATNERANTQYQTVLGEIKASGSDPMTKRELEARLAQFPQITDDLKENLRSERDTAYKTAKSAYDMGEQRAANYRIQLDTFKKTPTAIGSADFYKKLDGDQNVIFDRATGNVRSAFPMPRVDVDVTQNGILGSYKPGGVFPSAQEMQALGTPAPAGVVPTIGQMKARITGGIGNAAPVAASPAVTASDLTLAPETPSMVWPGIPTFTGIGRAIGRNVQVSPTGGITFPNLSLDSFVSPAEPRNIAGPMSYGGGVAIPSPRGVRISDFAQPQPTNAMPPSFVAPRPIQQMNLPQYQSPAGNIDALISMTRDPRFPTLPPEHQQWILDEIGNKAPRAFDLQGLRPEYVPMDDRYYAPQ